MPTLTVWSLNGGNFVGKTPDEEPQTLKWLKGLSGSDATVPDVLCLQHFRVSLLEHMRPLPHFHFAPMGNHKIWGGRELMGICIASRYPLNDIAIHYTWGNGVVRDVEGLGDDNERIKPDDIADALVLKTENYVTMACTVSKPGDPRPWRIATHHGLWTRKGTTTPEQMQSTDSLCDFLAEQGRKYGSIAYAADCNPDKAGRVLSRYQESGGRICLPSHIETTLAAHHPAAKLGIKTDLTVLWPNSSGEFTCNITDVYMDPSPGSDHDMLCCTVSRQP